MSKMSNINLMLQEQAEGLGFSTTQEALDNGFIVDYTAKEPTLVFDDDKARELAHVEWEREKKEILDGLDHIEISYRKVLDDDVEYINRAMRFIRGVSHE